MAQKVAARIINDFWQAIADAIDIFTSKERANYFQTCSYDRD